MNIAAKNLITNRFRKLLPVVVDIETAGLNHETDAILEIAAIILMMDETDLIKPEKIAHFEHVIPFEGSHIDHKALEFTGIDPFHPFRFAVSEKEALKKIFVPIRKALKETGCNRAILVGHNPTFDLNFLNAAIKRCHYEKQNPFHPFTSFDTATLAGVALGHTVLAVAVKRAGIEFNVQYAHSALYDATKTAELFCWVVNKNFRTY